MTDETLDLANRTLPAEVAEQFGIAFGLDKKPDTLADWVAISANHFGAIDSGTFRNRWVSGGTRVNVSRDDETCQPKGLFTGLLVAVAGSPDPVAHITAEPPDGKHTIEIHITTEGCTIEPNEAVMSFGVAENIVSPPYFDVPPAIAYARFAQYTHAFAGPQEYQAWSRRAEGVTSMSLPMPVAIETAEAMTRARGFEALDLLPA